MSAVIILEASIRIYGKTFYVAIWSNPLAGPSDEDQLLVTLSRKQQTDNPVEWRTFKRLVEGNLFKQAENIVRRQRSYLKQMKAPPIVKGFPGKLPPSAG